MSEITIRYVSHPGIFNWLCQIAQYGFWSTHCDVVMPDGRYLGARYADGVQSRPKNYDAGNFSREMFVKLIVTEQQAATFYEFLERQLYKPYDWISIVTFYSGANPDRDWQEDDSWDCSEVAGAALSACDVFPKRMAVGFNRLTVRDLLLLTSTITSAASGERDG